MAAHRKLDRRRDGLSAVGLHKRAQNTACSLFSERLRAAVLDVRPVDQKDKRKPIVLVNQRPKTPGEK
jgi:hypothetical protein